MDMWMTDPYCHTRAMWQWSKTCAATLSHTLTRYLDTHTRTAWLCLFIDIPRSPAITAGHGAKDCVCYRLLHWKHSRSAEPTQFNHDFYGLIQIGADRCWSPVDDLNNVACLPMRQRAVASPHPEVYTKGHRSTENQSKRPVSCYIKRLEKLKSSRADQKHRFPGVYWYISGHSRDTSPNPLSHASKLMAVVSALRHTHHMLADCMALNKQDYNFPTP